MLLLLMLVKSAVHADVVLLFLHGAVVARLGKAEVVVRDLGHGGVQLAAGAVRPVQVRGDD